MPTSETGSVEDWVCVRAVLVAVLRGGRELQERGHLEDASHTTSQAYIIVIAVVNVFRREGDKGLRSPISKIL